MSGVHTILKRDDKIFVGMWCKHPDDICAGGDGFVEIFEADSLAAAVIMTAALNGGEGSWSRSDNPNEIETAFGKCRLL